MHGYNPPSEPVTTVKGGTGKPLSRRIFRFSAFKGVSFFRCYQPMYPKIRKRTIVRIIVPS